MLKSVLPTGSQQTDYVTGTLVRSWKLPTTTTSLATDPTTPYDVPVAPLLADASPTFAAPYDLGTVAPGAILTDTFSVDVTAPANVNLTMFWDHSGALGSRNINGVQIDRIGIMDTSTAPATVNWGLWDNAAVRKQLAADHGVPTADFGRNVTVSVAGPAILVVQVSKRPTPNAVAGPSMFLIQLNATSTAGGHETLVWEVKATVAPGVTISVINPPDAAFQESATLVGLLYSGLVPGQLLHLRLDGTPSVTALFSMAPRVVTTANGNEALLTLRVRHVPSGKFTLPIRWIVTGPTGVVQDGYAHVPLVVVADWTTWQRSSSTPRDFDEPIITMAVSSDGDWIYSTELADKAGGFAGWDEYALSMSVYDSRRKLSLGVRFTGALQDNGAAVQGDVMDIVGWGHDAYLRADWDDVRLSSSSIHLFADDRGDIGSDDWHGDLHALSNVIDLTGQAKAEDPGNAAAYAGVPGFKPEDAWFYSDPLGHKDPPDQPRTLSLDPADQRNTAPAGPMCADATEAVATSNPCGWFPDNAGSGDDGPGGGGSYGGGDVDDD